MAIITDAKAGLEGTSARVKNLNKIKNHLVKAIELNPKDVAVLYMLGKWCYDMSNFTWLQRQITSVFFMAPPSSTYEEAFYYFARAEKIRPRFYLPNLYMLGRTSFHMNQFFRARYYLHMAANLPPRSNFEKECALKAKNLANQLEQYDIASDALLSGFSSDNVS